MFSCTWQTSDMFLLHLFRLLWRPLWRHVLSQARVSCRVWRMCTKAFASCKTRQASASRSNKKVRCNLLFKFKPHECRTNARGRSEGFWENGTWEKKEKEGSEEKEREKKRKREKEKERQEWERDQTIREREKVVLASWSARSLSVPTSWVWIYPAKLLMRNQWVEK